MSHRKFDQCEFLHDWLSRASSEKECITFREYCAVHFGGAAPRTMTQVVQCLQHFLSLAKKTCAHDALSHELRIIYAETGEFRIKMADKSRYAAVMDNITDVLAARFLFCERYQNRSWYADSHSFFVVEIPHS
jgi:hypothetical protein